MKYIKTFHLLQSSTDCKIHYKQDYGIRTEDNKYMLPALSDEIYLAKNLSKEQALELYEDVPLDELDKYKNIWKQKLKEQEELEKQQQQEDAQESELEDFDKEDE